MERALSSHHVAHAPHLIDPEVVSAIRRLSMHGGLSPQRASEALADYARLSIVRHAHLPLLDRVWGLRHRFTAYDATYVALAELFEAALVTTDSALAQSAGGLVVVAD